MPRHRRSFLEGQGIPVDLRNIETELSKLWGPAAEQIGGPELENPNVTRIVLANLVVECLDGDRRIIGPGAGNGDRAVSVPGDRRRRVRRPRAPYQRRSVRALPFAGPGMPQVCSERIVLRSGPKAIDLIPGAVRPLLEADLPMVLWWTGDPRTARAALSATWLTNARGWFSTCPTPAPTRLHSAWGSTRPSAECSRDSAWFGLARWRELIAQFFDPRCNFQSLKQIDAVRIEALVTRPGRPPRMAIWLAAWLAGQLGWKPQGQTGKTCAAIRDRVLRARFTSPAGEITVDIGTRPLPAGLPATPRLAGVTITTRAPQGAETFRLYRPSPDSPAIRVEAEATQLVLLAARDRRPELDPARRVAAALESSRLDPPFQKALPIALWLMDPSGHTPRPDASPPERAVEPAG